MFDLVRCVDEFSQRTSSAIVESPVRIIGKQRSGTHDMNHEVTRDEKVLKLDELFVSNFAIQKFHVIHKVRTVKYILTIQHMRGLMRWIEKHPSTVSHERHVHVPTEHTSNKNFGIVIVQITFQKSESTLTEIINELRSELWIRKIFVRTCVVFEREFSISSY